MLVHMHALALILVLGLHMRIMSCAKVCEYATCVQLDMHIFTDHVWLVVKYAVVCTILRLLLQLAPWVGAQCISLAFNLALHTYAFLLTLSSRTPDVESIC